VKYFLLGVLLSISAQAQVIGQLTDLPKNIFGVGVGVGPSRADVSAYGAYGKLLTQSGTYSMTGMTIVPARAIAVNGKSVIVITPTVHTGIEQIVFQKDRLTVVMDAGVGASLPSSGTPSFSFSGSAAGGFGWRLNKEKADTNKYMTFSMRAVQTPDGWVPTVFWGVAWGNK
jgi:hypothetical protein